MTTAILTIIGTLVGVVVGWILASSRNRSPEDSVEQELRVKLLQSQATGDLDKRQESIAGMLKPLAEQLKMYQARLQQSDSEHNKAIGEVRSQLEALGQRSQTLADETSRFRMVLSSSQARGRWGEETLRRLVEAAGMSVHCDFLEQSQQADSRPDMIVNLPGDHKIIVDSKAPDFTVVDQLQAATEQDRAAILEAHADRMRTTIRDLARRDYQSSWDNALDYVVMFVPAESIFSAALEADPNLIQWAAQQRIMLATPASLIALLRCVSVFWLQHEQSENSRKIADEASNLYGRITVLMGHYAKIGSGLEAANKAFNSLEGSYQRSVRPSAERLVELGVDSKGKQLPDMKQIESTLQSPASEV